MAGDGGNDHATGGMARTGNVDPKWPASSGGTVNLEDLEEPHNNNRGLGEQRMKRKRAYNVGESPRPERMRVIHTRGGNKRRVHETGTRGGYKRRVQRMKRKRAYNVGESTPRPEQMREIQEAGTRGGYKRRVQRMKRVQRVVKRMINATKRNR